MHTHHHEGQTAPDRPDRRLLWVLVLTLGFALVEAIAGWWSGSLALLSDAGHMLTDSLALGLAALAAILARRRPSGIPIPMAWGAWKSWQPGSMRWS